MEELNEAGSAKQIEALARMAGAGRQLKELVLALEKRAELSSDELLRAVVSVGLDKVHRDHRNDAKFKTWDDVGEYLTNQIGDAIGTTMEMDEAGIR